MFNVALNLLRQPKAESLEVSEQPVVAMSTMVEEPAGEVSKTSVENIATSEPAIETVNVDSDARNTLEEIYTWIDQIPFSRPRKNIARDFSDGVFMAELLKRYYPRYVELHNYRYRNSIAFKVDNWTTLNRKVLSKIGMKLSKNVITGLVYSKPGVIESVLADLRAKILKDCNADRDSLYFEYDDNGKETIKSVLNPEEVANTTVPRQAFVKLKHELQEKKSTINTLNEKVTHLESLMKLKDQRIADLTAQVTSPVEKNLTSRSSIGDSVNLRLDKQ